MVIKRSPGGQACRWRAINFEIHLWSSGQNADCIFGDRSASSMSKWRPAWTLTPEMIHFRTKSVTLSMLIDLLIIVHVDRRRWRAHQLTYDLKRCLLFRKCLRFFESESSFGAYVCHRRPGGSMATSHLVVSDCLMASALLMMPEGRNNQTVDSYIFLKKKDSHDVLVYIKNIGEKITQTVPVRKLTWRSDGRFFLLWPANKGRQFRSWLDCIEMCFVENERVFLSDHLPNVLTLYGHSILEYV